jgi:excisionase family DNA binding protein
MSPLLLTPQEVAERLAISKSFVYQLIEEGEIQAVRIKRRVRVEEAELGRFISERRTPRRRIVLAPRRSA